MLRIPILLASIFLLLSANAFEISEKGYWIGDVDECHANDPILGEAIANFFLQENAQSVVDFGCGMGAYVSQFRGLGIAADGYDGNPETPILSQGICSVKDLSEPFLLDQTYDWVMSLEVGEHLPQQFERIFIENILRHAKTGIVISWAIKGQGGTGHFNEQDNEYIKSIFEEYGCVNDLAAENFLRSKAECGWFKNSLMVFRK